MNDVFGKSVQIGYTWVRTTQNRTRIVRHGDSSKYIDAQLSEVEDDGEEEYGSETSITKILMPGTRELRQEQWFQVAWDKVALREEKEFASSGKQTDSVREETDAVSGTAAMGVQNQHQKPLQPLNHQHQEVEVRREKGVWEDQSTAVQKLLERYLPQITLCLLASSRMSILWLWIGL